MRAPLALVLLLVCGPALHAQDRVRTIETDTGRVVLRSFTTGEVSTSEWTDKEERFGRSRAFTRAGTVIFDRHTRRIGGHASVHFSYHPGGAVSKAEVSDAPDAGIQWYRSTTTFDEEGNRTGFSEESNELLERTYTQPIEPPGPMELPLREPEVAICQQLFVNEVFLVNATRQAARVDVHVSAPTPALGSGTHTLAPGDTLRLGTYSIGMTFAPPGEHLSVEAARILRNRKRKAKGTLRTATEQVAPEHRRHYMVIHTWKPLGPPPSH